MKRILIILTIAIYGWMFFLPKQSLAIEDPLALPNNKVGVHILFPSEIYAAADLVNSNGGDWGYVTIPIQAGDRDLLKWQNFMNAAKKLHLIPLVRLATEGDYFNTKVWRKPTDDDVLDFANFLNSLEWPVKNRYIVIFNEVNRSDEWGGKLDSADYAQILSYSVQAFKSLNNDFFIISSGLDNAAPNQPGDYMDEYNFMIAMNEAAPGIFNQIDGLGSHSYPNPGFKQMPYILTSQSIDSFNFENNLAYRLSGKNLPVFITETGWSKDALSESDIASYYKYAYDYVWNDKSIASVNSFLLYAGQGPFFKFSLTDGEGESKILQTIKDIPKIKGTPTVNKFPDIPAENTAKNLPIKSFPKNTQYKVMPIEKTNVLTDFLKWLFKLSQ